VASYVQADVSSGTAASATGAGSSGHGHTLTGSTTPAEEAKGIRSGPHDRAPHAGEAPTDVMAAGAAEHAASALQGQHAAADKLDHEPAAATAAGGSEQPEAQLDAALQGAIPHASSQHEQASHAGDSRTSTPAAPPSHETACAHADGLVASE
jgi:hypothetical protein